MGKEKLVGICDASGSLYDPAGIDRHAIEKLARQRQVRVGGLPQQLQQRNNDNTTRTTAWLARAFAQRVE